MDEAAKKFVVVLTRNRGIAEQLQVAILSLWAQPYWLDPKFYNHLAVAQIRRSTGRPYPAQPDGVVIDDELDCKEFHPKDVVNQLTLSFPPIPCIVVARATRAEAFTRATRWGQRPVVGVVTHGDTSVQLVRAKLQVVLYPTVCDKPEGGEEGWRKG